jgi:uncharacterized repeat protein (TIGR03803 family)
MRSTKLSIGMTVLAMFTLFITPTLAAAQQETVLLDLTYNGGVGGDPQDGMIIDAAGNLYGTTAFGGPRNGGAVFELSPNRDGTWTTNLLHAFISNIHDGQRPQAGLTLDSSGNLYGTTYWGGAYNNLGGTVFELIPQADGKWKEELLHSFGGASQDGQRPQAGVIFDSVGNLYGTTMVGGTHNLGTVFELMPQAGGGWKEKLLHTFSNDGHDGYTLLAGLILDANGNLYGATASGGAFDAGTVFELIPTTSGPWKEKILHNFNRSGDGNFPYGTLIFDPSGNLYGTTTQGGSYGWGTVFELTHLAGGGWAETLLHNFNKNATDGDYPYSRLIFDAAGNLYGTTEGGGPYDAGTVFKLTPTGGGNWTETVLHSFNNDGTDGVAPLGCLVFDAAGNLYGTTDEGGTAGSGTVFKVTP